MNKISYEEFKKLYVDAFKNLITYSPDQIGSHVYAEKLAILSDNYPAFELKLENETNRE